MKILITDKNSFVTKQLVNKLKTNNEITVLNSTNELLNLFSKNLFDVCIHNLSQDNVQDSIDNPLKTYEINTSFTHDLLMQCREVKTKLIYLSSWMVYDTTNELISEKSKINPKSPYATSKLSSEFLIKSFGSAYDVEYVILRMFNVYGPGKEYGVVYYFLNNTLNNKSLILYGDGTQSRDFIFVTDSVEAITLAMTSDKALNNIINIGSGLDLTVKDLANSISSNIEHKEHLHQKSEVLRAVCDNTKSRQLLSWEPKVSLSQGLSITKRWLQDEFT